VSEDGEPARSGAELWRTFVAMAGLEPTSYDRDLVAAVASGLELDGGGDLGDEIERAGVDATAVLVALFEAIGPWVQMMRDLLVLMRDCGATKTTTQLRADVDVAGASETLDLDLTSFTEAIGAYEEIVETVLRPSWSIDALERLGELLPMVTDADGPHPREAVRAWLLAYQPEPAEGAWELPDVPWPPPPAEPPRSGDPRLDRALAAAWSALVDLITTAAAGSRSRFDLEERKHRLREEEGDFDRAGQPTLGWIAIVDSDRFPSLVAAGLEAIAARVRAGDRSAWSRIEEHSPSDLIDLVEGLPRVSEPRAVTRQLQGLLSLPVWKHRYDLYSNWVFTRIVAALRERVEVTVHQRDARIDFGFAATKMASCPGHELAVFSELRSDLVGESEKRKESVQPDYSVLVGDETDPTVTSVLEVECKQYGRADRRNFAIALQDYARSRSSAMVNVVSYGSVSDRVRDGILEDVNEKVRGRCAVRGDIRPHEDAALAAFATAIRAAALSPEEPRVPPGLPVRIELHWKGVGGVDADLDLQLEIEGDDKDLVDFRRTTAGEGDPHAVLESDVTAPPGPEILTVQRWLGATYRLSVHRYAGDSLDDCEPRVVLRSADGAGAIELDCPAGEGDWWRVLEIDGATGAVQPIGRREA
jgi:hypothetical protein